jgi:transcriptional regulator GlxA family with amidase domain
MMRQDVYFVVLPETLLVDLAGPADAVRMANRYQTAVQFEMAFVGPAAEVATSVGLVCGGLGPLPIAVRDDAMIVVSGSVAAPNEQVVQWLRQIARPTQRLVFICTGALVAARAGLLDGRSCTTHHDDCGALRRMAPRATVVDNRIYVVDGPVYTSAGVTAGLDLMLALISDIAGPQCAAAVARNMLVYVRRAGADPQISPWLDGRNHLHPALHRVQDAVTADPARAWTAAELARLAETSSRHLTRLFHVYAGTTPVDYIQRLRVALVRELLAHSRLTLEQVAGRAGFGSSRHMRRVWGKYNPLPPSQSRTS